MPRCLSGDELELNSSLQWKKVTNRPFKKRTLWIEANLFLVLPADIVAMKTNSYLCEVREVLYRLLGLCSTISVLEITRSVNTTRINGSIKIWRTGRPCSKILQWGKKFSWNPSEVRGKCSDQVWNFLLTKILAIS